MYGKVVPLKRIHFSSNSVGFTQGRFKHNLTPSLILGTKHVTH